MAILKDIFGNFQDNKPVYLFTLRNIQGTEIKITNWGCIITSIRIKDKRDKYTDVVLGFGNFKGYLGEHPYFGAVIGRYANRISGGNFTLNREKYLLALNNGNSHLHGGLKGFDKVLWNYKLENNSIILSYFSSTGEEGYPGNLNTDVTYSLSDNNELIISYEARSDSDTIINLTNHSYFNLNGECDGSILDHQLTLFADYFLPIDRESIPTGEKCSVKNTPFDFRAAKKIGEHISSNNLQLNYAMGYDHNYILGDSGKLKRAAILSGDKSGIRMEIITTEPGIQFYSGNFLDGTLMGKNCVYRQRSGVCLETQHYPDSPHFKDFPSTILKKDDIFKSKTIYRFSVESKK